MMRRCCGTGRAAAAGAWLLSVGFLGGTGSQAVEPDGLEPIDVGGLLAWGGVQAAHSPLDIGIIGQVFDGSTFSLARTGSENPMRVTLEFGDWVDLRGFRLWFLGGRNRWLAEAADNLTDLETEGESYRLLVDGKEGEESEWSEALLSEGVSCRAVRLTLRRLTGDDHVHLCEWELLTPVAPAGPSLGLRLDIDGNSMELTWAARPGSWYRVQGGQDLTAWKTLDVVKAAGTRVSFEPPLPPVEEQAYFRVIQAKPEDRERIQKRVLVLNYEPVLESRGSRTVREVMGWNEPRLLTEAYYADIEAASGDYVDWITEEWIDIDAWPRKIDGFVYDDVSWLRAWEQGQPHEPDGVDYAAIVEEFGIDDRVRRGEIHEVILWGFPYAGYYESRMAGATAYWCNAPPLQRLGVPLYVIMGLNYERGVAEAAHSFGHRVESIMRRVYGSWSGGPEINHLWDRFSRYEGLAPGQAACGNVHFPPNGRQDYDYGNAAVVQSEADDWLNFPDLTGARRPLTSAAWDGSHRGFMKWWLTRLPKAPGRNADGKLNNWWGYLVDMNEYPESR
ncbi:MAG TPA: hypothetical protein VMN36_11200 [Verrucomicrobiales bacterium]|nr:hypothetical protein [Verrucomicrobiales bacterium]